MPVLPLYSIRDTQLWQRLSSFPGTDTDKDLAGNLAQRLVNICEDAEDRMKGFAAQHPQYTLHDKTHLLRVTELMWRVMPQGVAEKLNPVEITLLILAAYFHDQGMVLDADERAQLEANSEFRLHQQNWEVEHPNLRDVKQRLRDQSLSEAEVNEFTANKSELEAASLTDYVRKTHGESSARMVREKFADDQNWVIAGRNVADLVAHLCLSHVLPASSLTDDAYRVDEAVGFYRVNLRYLAVVLRLADILDFDADRAPHPLSRTIDFRSKVSEAEWAKHLAVKGEEIESGLVRFTMECEKPEYQRAALEFMDWIDVELAAAQEIINRVPHQVAGYRIDLPVAVDRSRIEPKDGAYIYSDLEFSLSRDEIVKLLMTDQLYGSPSLCIRELVQNAMDALRHRSAIFQRDNDGQEWTRGKVTMTHELDEHGHEVVRCIDNGIGMTRQTIEKFLTRAGRSYYRSPEWEQERQSLRAAGVDFDPCAQFGIGFMSCFMLGDRIKITTRRDNGWGKDVGDPLVVEINGLSSMVVIRDGEASQPAGTTVEITGRKKPRFLRAENDQVQIVKALKAFILNCEFPVEIRCGIEGIEEALTIQAGFLRPETLEPFLPSTNFLVFDQPFSDFDSLYLKGEMRAGFHVNQHQELTLESEAGKWVPTPISRLYFQPTESDYCGRFAGTQKVSLDGIFVLGTNGSGKDFESKKSYIEFPAEDKYWQSNSSGFNYILDIRGKIKPPISPDRFPTNRQKDRAWKYVETTINSAAARIWQIASARPECQRTPTLIWNLGFVLQPIGEDDFIFLWLSPQCLHQHYSIPFLDAEDKESFRSIGQIGEFTVAKEIEEIPEGEEEKSKYKYKEKRCSPFLLVFTDSSAPQFGNKSELDRWLDWDGPMAKKLEWLLTDLLILLSTLVLIGAEVSFDIQRPVGPDVEAPLIKFLFRREKELRIEEYIFHIPYAADAAQFISVHCPCISANRNHPLSREAVNHNFDLAPSRFGDLPEDILWLLCHPDNAELLRASDGPMPRWVIEIAHRVLETEWGDTGLAPPYKVRLEDGVTVEITRETFERWANAEPLDDDEK